MTFLAQKGPGLQKRNELSNEIYFKELVLNKGLVKAECFVNLSAGEHSVPEFPTLLDVWNGGALLNRIILIRACHSDLIESNQ